MRSQITGEAKGNQRSASILWLAALAMPPIIVGDIEPRYTQTSSFTIPGCGVCSAAEEVAVVAVTPGEGDEEFLFV